MNVSCPDCRSIFRVDPAKVPPTGRPRPLLGLQRCDLHSRAHGTEYSSLRKRARARLAQRPGRRAFHSRRSIWLGSCTLLSFISFIPAIRATTTGSRAAYRRNARQPAPQARGDRSWYRRGHRYPSVSRVRAAGVHSAAPASSVQASRSATFFSTERIRRFLLQQRLLSFLPPPAPRPLRDLRPPPHGRQSSLRPARHPSALTAARAVRSIPSSPKIPISAPRGSRAPSSRTSSPTIPPNTPKAFAMER